MTFAPSDFVCKRAVGVVTTYHTNAIINGEAGGPPHLPRMSLACDDDHCDASSAMPVIEAKDFEGDIEKMTRRSAERWDNVHCLRRGGAASCRRPWAIAKPL